MNENETQPAYFDDFEITHKANPQKLTVSSWAEYYAFGKVAKASCSGAGSYRYGYQGEFAEKDGETDWNSFELRQYDSDIARWLSVDPYQQYWSPYVGMGNDPVNQIDPDGGLSGGGGGQGGGGGGEITPITPRSYQPMSPSGNVCPPDIKMTPGAGGSSISPPSPPVTSFADRAVSWMAAAASRVTPFMGGAAAFAGAMLMSHPAGPTGGGTSEMPYRKSKEDDDYITLYRGVSENTFPNSIWEMAQNGMAMPKGYLPGSPIKGGHSSPSRHSNGDNWSIWTSWTTDYNVARRFALDSGDSQFGVVLIKRFHRQRFGVDIIQSRRGSMSTEKEWLVPGTIYGAGVEDVHNTTK